jgi:hypothetical protein
VIFAGFGCYAGFLIPTDSVGTRKWPQGRKRFFRARLTYAPPMKIDGTERKQRSFWILVACCAAGPPAGSRPIIPGSMAPRSRPRGTSVNQGLATGTAVRELHAIGVGNSNVSLPLAFDTGSAGLTLYAPNIFPSNMVTPNGGFVFPAGQTSLTYLGVADGGVSLAETWFNAMTQRSPTLRIKRVLMPY